MEDRALIRMVEHVEQMELELRQQISRLWFAVTALAAGVVVAITL